jgi:MFS family permease
MSNPNNESKWVLGLTAVASLMVALDALVLATALTEIGRAFDASIEGLEWTANAYILSFAVLLMTAAAMGDRFGRRRVFAAGLSLFVIASAACALAPGVGWLIVARAVQGTGAAMIMPLALALVSAAFPPERRGWALGIYSGVTALSTVLGPVVGGAITQGLAWQWVFWLNVPIGLLTLVLTFGRLREVSDRARKSTLLASCSSPAPR